MKINWKQKLTSRKFWAAVIGFVTAVLVAVGVKDPTAGQIIAVISAVATLIAYIVGEVRRTLQGAGRCLSLKDKC